MLYSVAKTDLDINQVSTFVEDRMIIKRDGNFGKLYYDFEKLEDGTTKRIEISPNRLYKVNTITDSYSIANGIWYLDKNNEVACTSKDIELYSLIYDDYNVIGLIINKDDTNITIKTILNPSQAVVWNDYK